MQNLLHFLTDLAQNPAKQEQYAQNPAATLEAANLSASLLHDLQANNLATAELAKATGACFFGDPGPDPLPDPDPVPIPQPDGD